MASRKESSWIRSARTAAGKLLGPLAGNGRGLAGIVALVIVLVAGAYIGWTKYGGDIRQRSQYLLTEESFEITPQPEWIQSDIKAEVIRDGRLEALSALDPDLTKNVVQAFELNTWVAKVLWAGKRPGKAGPRIIVEVRYREPIAMVRTKDKSWEGDCFWPVDTEGVLLPPGEFSSNQTCNYMRVDAGDAPPVGAVGTPYGDSGVAGAVAVAVRIGAAWQSMGLEWIVVHKDMVAEVGQPIEPTFVLLPTGGDPSGVARRATGQLVSARESSASTLEIFWGRAPGKEREGEAKAAQKINRLQMFVTQNGPLDQLPTTTVIDLRPSATISVMHRPSTVQPAAVR